jgi:hypothetical protein
MGIERVVWITCDYEKCANGTGGKPALLTWNETHVESGQAQAPEESKYLVLSSHNGKPKTFCCQLCASKYFLPPGYDIMKRKVIPFPGAVTDEGPVGQPDGAGPEEAA